VGLVWSGSATHDNDANRSIELTTLLAQLPDGIDLVSLQKDVRERDRPALQSASHIACFSDELHDFSDTAALCSLMDVVLTVDTSVAHLAGALGVPTWVLLPHHPDWRWLLGRDDSPWYPSVRLYRQAASGSWDAVLQRVARAARAAPEAAHAGEGAVQLHHAAAARGGVQAVDVLGDGPAERAEGLQGREGAVRRAGAGGEEARVPHGGAGPVPLSALGAAHEFPVLHGGLVALRAVGSAVVGDARVGAAARPREGHHAAAAEQRGQGRHIAHRPER
jgi:hypothetical protein